MTTKETDGLDLLGTLECSPHELAYIEICRSSAEIAKKHRLSEGAEAIIHNRIFRAIAKNISLKNKVERKSSQNNHLPIITEEEQS